MTRCLVLLLVVPLVIAGCSKNSPTSPTTTPTTTTTTPPPLTNETFSGTLGVGATTYFPFTVAQAGTVTAALSTIGGAGVPATVQVRLGLGTIDDIAGCNATVTALVNQTTPTLTATEAVGNYCVNVTDVGNLFAAADFTIVVTHP